MSILELNDEEGENQINSFNLIGNKDQKKSLKKNPFFILSIILFIIILILIIIFIIYFFIVKKIKNEEENYVQPKAKENIIIEKFLIEKGNETIIFFSNEFIKLSNYDYQIKINGNIFSSIESYKFINPGIYIVEIKLFVNITNAKCMFCDVKNLVELDMSQLITDDIQDTSQMFLGLASLKNLTLGNFNTDKVVDMSKIV